MQATYNVWLVSLSIVVAMVVSYTALKLAARVADAEGSGGRLWLLGGAVAMGTGIWSMHFIGMLAFSVPTPLRYGVFRTVGSLIIAIITSGFALSIASRSELSLRRLGFGALVMGTGISAMHYSGMAAITIVPMHCASRLHALSPSPSMRSAQLFCIFFREFSTVARTCGFERAISGPRVVRPQPNSGCIAWNVLR